MANGILTGEPVECRCGRQMVVKFTELIKASFRDPRPVGVRYMYVCDACRRRLDVRWIERDMRRGDDAETRGRGDLSAGSAQAGAGTEIA